MWVDVGDERRARPLLELGSEGGREREDVGDDDIRLQLAHERQGVPCGLNDRLVEVEWLRAGGEHAVLGRGGEAKALGLDILSPARPCLQCDVVAARAERAAEGDHRECVAGVAECAEQHRRPFDGQSRAASSASRRSCSRRSGAGERGRRHAERAHSGISVDRRAARVRRPSGRTARRCRSAGRGSRPSPPRACLRGTGPESSGPPAHSRSAARAGCRSSACASPSRRRTAR